MTPINFEQMIHDAPLPELICMVGLLQVRMLERLSQPAPVTPAPEDLLTVADVAKRLHMSAYRVYELVRQRKLKAEHLGKSVRVRPSALTEYVAKQGA